MHPNSILLTAIVQLFSGICLAQSDHLNLTTIALVNKASVIQCWQLDQAIFPLGPSNETDLGPLGHPVNATWMKAPAGTKVPPHPANAVE